jgi:predicted RNA-binding protein YlqC (UPF0109 family)
MTSVTASNDESMRQLVLEIARSIVDDSDAVSIDIKVDESATTLNLRVAPTDESRVIGKQGRTARSIRTILSAASMKLQHRYALHIEDGKSETGGRSSQYEQTGK